MGGNEFDAFSAQFAAGYITKKDVFSYIYGKEQNYFFRGKKGQEVFEKWVKKEIETEEIFKIMEEYGTKIINDGEIDENK